MTPLLFRLLGFVVAFTLFCGCALTKDRFRPMPAQGQTKEQGLKDQEECNEIALANKGNAAPASAMPAALGVAAGAASGAALGVSLGGAVAGAAARAAAGAGAGAAAGFLLMAITEVERRGTAIYVACMEARGYTVGE